MTENTDTGVVLDSDALGQLNNAEAKSLLDTIDNLRELQVGEIVNLPQIIVVGDQSSGKSSVLEAISRVRFPVKGDVCTRFATELVLRRGPRTSLDVSIQYFAGTHTSAAEPFRKTTFDRDALPDIIEEAKQRMGIQGNASAGFSKDVLRVHITDPDVYSLTLVDLPGFFHSRMADQSGEGKQIVYELVEKYMAQKNSIILAVVSANSPLANQLILEEAIKHDPTRERTLGVITKPDLLQRGSAEERAALQLAKGEEKVHKLTLGWHVLRNRSEAEENSGVDERDTKEEAFFRAEPWNSIVDSNRGIDKLRKRLSRILLEHIRKTLPGLIVDIEANLRSRQEQLERLGNSRSTPEELRSYLLDISEKFQRLARDAVDGRYNDEFFGGLYGDERKLRAQLRNLNRAFGVTLMAKGAAHKIKWNDDDERAGSDGDDVGYDNLPQYLQPFVNMYNFPEPEPISEDELNSSLEVLAAVNQGREFPGSPTVDLVVQLFKTEAEPWREIAQFHLNLVTDFTKSFVEKLFSHVIGPDPRTLESVLRGAVDPFFDDKKTILAAKLGELVRPYTAGFGLPLEAEFRSKLSRRTVQRLANNLADVLEEEHSSSFGDNPRVGLNRKMIMQTITDAEGFRSSEFGTEQVIDMMTVYYEISLRTFMENVINLAVESCLVWDLPDIITPGKVDRMDEDKLAELAAESEEVQSERQMLQEQVRVLRDGLSKCQKQRPRAVTALPFNFPGPSSHSGRRSISRTASPAPSPAPASTPNSTARAASTVASGTSQAATPIRAPQSSTASLLPSSSTSASNGTSQTTTPVRPPQSSTTSLFPPSSTTSTTYGNPSPLFASKPQPTGSSASSIFGPSQAFPAPPSGSIFATASNAPVNTSFGGTRGLFGSGQLSAPTTFSFSRPNPNGGTGDLGASGFQRKA